MNITESTGFTTTFEGISAQVPPPTPLRTMNIHDVRDFTQTLAGKIKTIIDAAIAEPRQNKATKDLAHNAIWETYDIVRNWSESQGPNVGSSFPLRHF